MKKNTASPPDRVAPAQDDPLEAAVRARLDAITAEPVPPHLTDLAKALQAALHRSGQG